MARALLVGVLVGFPIAASPGPMFFLVLRRTLARGWRSGLISGLGIATGDAIYAAVAAFGVAAVTSLLISQRRWIGLVGGVALIAIGVRTLWSPHPDPPERLKRSHRTKARLAWAGRPALAGEGKGGAYLSMVALTLGNPPTILSFTAVFAGLGVHVASGWQPAIALVIGVMLGSLLWWVLLTVLVAVLRTRISAPMTRLISLVSGLALIVFGALISLQSL
jgi:threonine/homoserine/homoserine lactone efflux protein